MLNSLMMLLAQLEQDSTAGAVAEKTAEGAATENPGGMFQLLLPMMAAMLVIMLLMRPKKVDQKQKQLLEEFQNISNEKNHPVSDGFFKKLRDLWH